MQRQRQINRERERERENGGGGRGGTEFRGKTTNCPNLKVPGSEVWENNLAE